MSTKKDLIKDIDTKLSSMKKDEIIKVKQIITNLDSVNISTEPKAKKKYTPSLLRITTYRSKNAINFTTPNKTQWNAVKYSIKADYNAKAVFSKDKKFMYWQFANKQDFNAFLKAQKDYAENNKQVSVEIIDYESICKILGFQVGSALKELYKAYKSFCLNPIGAKYRKEEIIKYLRNLDTQVGMA